MTATIQCILDRRSIRKYMPEQISDDELELILTAGTYAPNAGSRQSPVMVVLQDDSLIQTLGRINRNIMRQYMPVAKAGNVSLAQPSIADDDSIESAFYGAPTVVVVFAPKAHRYAVEDGTFVIGNMMLAAHSLGVGSCMVARAAETFATDEGRAIIGELGVAQDYQAIGFCVLGYRDGDLPLAKPRKEYVIKRVR